MDNTKKKQQKIIQTVFIIGLYYPFSKRMDLYKDIGEQQNFKK